MTDMMFTCTTPICTDPRHGHRFAGVRKGSAAAVRARKRSVSSKLIRDRKGRTLRVDIHCHYLNRDAAAKLAHLNPAQYEPSVKFASALTREVNDRLAEIVAKWPDRFVGLGTVPLQNVELAVIELERCVRQLGLRGVEINPDRKSTRLNSSHITIS